MALTACSMKNTVESIDVVVIADILPKTCQTKTSMKTDADKTTIMFLVLLVNGLTTLRGFGSTACCGLVGLSSCDFIGSLLFCASRINRMPRLIKKLSSTIKPINVLMKFSRIGVISFWKLGDSSNMLFH